MSLLICRLFFSLISYFRRSGPIETLNLTSDHMTNISGITCNLPEIKYGYIRNVILEGKDQLDIQCKPNFYNPYTTPIRCVQGDTFSVAQPFSCLPGLFNLLFFV